MGRSCVRRGRRGPGARHRGAVATAVRERGAVRERRSGLAAKLRELRDRMGWTALGYDSWAECVQGEFNYSKQHANRLIAAQQTRGRVEPIGSTESPDGGAVPESHTQHLPSGPWVPGHELEAIPCPTLMPRSLAQQAKERRKRKPVDSVPANFPEQKGDARDQAGDAAGASGPPTHASPRGRSAPCPTFYPSGARVDPGARGGVSDLVS